MKSEAERWTSLGFAEREAELKAEALGIPQEKTLRRIREGTPKP